MKPDCRFVSHPRTFQGKQALTYGEGITSESAGSEAICMQYLTIPPGVRAYVHLHDTHETAIYMLDGEAGMLWGENLENERTVSAGEFVYIPAGMPHLPFNSSSRAASAVLARTDPNEQESVVLLPHLEEVAEVKLAGRGVSVPSQPY